MTTPKSWHDANRKALGLPPDWGGADLPRSFDHADLPWHDFTYELPADWGWTEIELPDGRTITGIVKP